MSARAKPQGRRGSGTNMDGAVRRRTGGVVSLRSGAGLVECVVVHEGKHRTGSPPQANLAMQSGAITPVHAVAMLAGRPRCRDRGCSGCRRAAQIRSDGQASGHKARRPDWRRDSLSAYCGLPPLAS